MQVGVIISLLYLARQIKSSAEQTREAVTQSLIAKGTAFLTQIAHNSSSADIWSRGLSGMENLKNDGERMQFSYLVITILRAYEELFHHGRKFKLDYWVKNALDTGARDLYATLGFRQVWSIRKQWFSEEFSQNVNESINQVLLKDPAKIYRNFSNENT